MSGTLLLLATRSEGKLRELRQIFADFGLRVADLSSLGIAKSPTEDTLEAFDTFEENALAKARYFYKAAAGIPTFGDDSGMCVYALGGEPGVLSKRWSGRDDLEGAALDAANNQKLLSRMKQARQTAGRQFTAAARYVAVAAFKDVHGEVTRRGEIEGRVIETPRGNQGFGYDPYFLADELGMTLAEATVLEKQQVSHRGRAFAELIAALRARGVIGVGQA